MKKRAKASIAISAAILTALGLIIPLFLVPSASPLGTYIQVHVQCEQTQTPIAGLPVTLKHPDGTTISTMPTNADGCAGPFGSGLQDGDYIVEFYWADTFSYPVSINCTQIRWNFSYEVCNPQIIKHFYYDLNDGSQPPVTGLNVSLYEDDVFNAWQLTDATGTVSWVVDVCHDYALKYMWGGVQYTEPEAGYIHFDVPPASLTWEAWNGLEPKSEGSNMGRG